MTAVDLDEPVISETPDTIVWEDGKGVPISESRKKKWIQDCIDYLIANPDETETWVMSGDTQIKVTREDTFYLVEEFEPKRWGFVKRDPNSSKCKCDMTTINSKGCQCGGI